MQDYLVLPHPIEGSRRDHEFMLSPGTPPHGLNGANDEMLVYCMLLVSCPSLPACIVPLLAGGSPLIFFLNGRLATCGLLLL